MTVLTILVMGTVPLAQNAVKRQKELQLRETLRDIREAIDEFQTRHYRLVSARFGDYDKSGSGKAPDGPMPPPIREAVLLLMMQYF